MFYFCFSFQPPDNQGKVKSMRTVHITDAFSNKQSAFKEGGEEDKLLTEALVYMVVKDSWPFNTPEKEGFKKMLKCVVPYGKALAVAP